MFHFKFGSTNITSNEYSSPIKTFKNEFKVLVALIFINRFFWQLSLSTAFRCVTFGYSKH
jgi:hypothetical protein